jgi:hypothetical protein
MNNTAVKDKLEEPKENKSDQKLSFNKSVPVLPSLKL